MGKICKSEPAGSGAQNLSLHWKAREYRGIASYTTGEQAEWFQQLCHFALRKAVITRLRRFYGRPRLGRVVDLGCATGDWTIDYAEFSERVVGVDINPFFLNEAKQRAEASSCADRVSFLVMNLADFCDYKRAGLVCFGACLTLVEDEAIDEIFANLARSAAPGTLIYIRVAVSCLRRRAFRTKKGNYRRREWYLSRFKSHGFRVLDESSSAAVIAGEMALEATKGKTRLARTIEKILHGFTMAIHFINGRADRLNWILEV